MQNDSFWPIWSTQWRALDLTLESLKSANSRPKLGHSHFTVHILASYHSRTCRPIALQRSARLLQLRSNKQPLKWSPRPGKLDDSFWEPCKVARGQHEEDWGHNKRKRRSVSVGDRPPTPMRAPPGDRQTLGVIRSSWPSFH